MIKIDAKPLRFNLRVAGLAIRDNHVLVHRALTDNFWTFPGGRGEIGESSAETLRREMAEELNVDARIGTLLFTVENFFHFERRAWHELGFYYRMDLPTSLPFAPETIIHRMTDGKSEVEFKWVPATKARLAALPIQPDFFIDRIDCLPERSEHLVWREHPPA